MILAGALFSHCSTMICKRNIPADLLRRSSRLKRPVDGDDEPDREDTKNGASSDPAFQKRSKLEPKVAIILEQSTVISGDDIKPKIKAPQPEGLLDIDEEELDLERTLLGGQSFRWTKQDLDEGKQQVFTGVVLDHAMQIWRISPSQVAFRTLNKEASASTATTLLEDYFQLKYNLRDLYTEWSKRDKHLAECCKQYRGFRILRQDPVENVFSFICATNNNIKRISQMVDKLCKRYGTILNAKDEKESVYNSFQSFPPVERLIDEDVFQCLRNELGFGYRAKFITETARQLLKLSQENDGMTPRDYLLSLRKLPYAETCKQLTQFQGIGRKVADCICLMSMDHLNSVPIDCHIYEIVCRNYLPNLRQERKTLTDSVHDLIANHFTKLHGPLAGWSTSVLFIAELKHLKQQEELVKKPDKKRSKGAKK